MTSPRHRAGRFLLCTSLLLGALLSSAPGALADTPELDWGDCGDGFQCATAKVPLDYGKSSGRKIDLAVIRKPAQDRSRRIGSLFINFGGPGGPGVEILRVAAPAFAALNDRFDLVSWDPRGVGESDGAVDCAVNQETDGIYGQPLARPTAASEADLLRRTRNYLDRCLARNADSGLLPYISTTNTARDLDQLRAAVGDDKLSYLGYSGGTHIGALHATLFPGRARVLALDGALDVEGFVNQPIEDVREQTAGFERALGRFFQACAAQQAGCAGFGGGDPWATFDDLVERLDAESLPAPTAANPTPVDGDDARVASLIAMYSKSFWPVLAAGLAQAQTGDASILRDVADLAYGRREDGSYDPGFDTFVAIFSLDARWPSDAGTYLEAGRHAYDLFDHFWFNSGYGDIAFGLWPVEPRGAYYGPISNSSGSGTALVVGTTYDPATIYKWSRALTEDLGNARLLTMRGDGHTASFGENSPCIDAAVEAYLEERMLPAPGTVCRQEVPFAQPEPEPTARSARKVLRQHRPIIR